ncbi:hypothetical protein ACUYO0_004221 [Vibrio vulnificus]
MKGKLILLGLTSLCIFSPVSISAVDQVQCDEKRDIINKSYDDALVTIKKYQEDMIQYSISGKESDLILYTVIEQGISQQFELLQMSVKLKKICGFN